LRRSRRLRRSAALRGRGGGKKDDSDSDRETLPHFFTVNDRYIASTN
jgi:hypothetical protein